MSEKKAIKNKNDEDRDTIDAAKLFVAAIDFGTTYSGYAFSTKSQPNSIYTCDWKKSSLLSYKAPTSVLLNHNKEFLAFGYDAESRYMSSLENDSDDDDSGEEKDAVYYFRRFKMALHNESVDMDSLIKDESGFKMKAFDIFTFAIKYLKDQTINKLKRTLTDVDIADIHYVLTVPAIWEDKAKMFMRKSAEKAGIKGDQLTIALEPEAASIYCQELRTDRENKTNITFSETIKKGMKYVVVDLGGGTADITVHERQPDGLLEEVVPPSGGAWGGTAIDDAYLKFLEKVFGEKVVKELKLKELEDYTELIHEFEVKKRSIKTDTTSDIVITMPVGLMNIIKKHCGGIDTAIKKSPYSDSISVSGQQKLCVNPQKFRDLFKPTINSLLKHLDQLFRHPKVSDIQHIIMVGGFSECELVQKEMKDKFPKKKIIIPEEAGLAVLKGAVLYGYQPEKINKRILKKTYGIQSWPEWDSEVHPETKRVRIDGTDRCKDVFYKFAVKGEKVEAGHSYGQIFQALKPDERTLECTVYISDDTNPRYVTDPSCQRLGNLIVPLPPLQKGQSLEIEETMIFGGTELLFRAKNMKTGEIYETQFQF